MRSALRPLHALALLALAACGNSPELDRAQDEATPDHEGPVGVAQGALGTANALYFSSGDRFSGNLYIYYTDIPDLGSADNLAASVKNSTNGPVTLWSGKNYTGRCEVVPGNTGYEYLYEHDIGRGQLSSIQFGDHCHNNPDGLLVELMNEDGFCTFDVFYDYDCSGGCVNSSHAGFLTGQSGSIVLPVSANAYQIHVEIAESYPGATRFYRFHRTATDGYATPVRLVLERTNDDYFFIETLR